MANKEHLKILKQGDPHHPDSTAQYHCLYQKEKKNGTI